ncbi:hypothetical protein GCM10007388_27110 [Pseudoduganella plicata]|uniref:Uncharacterized protein n=1 Tax=Pseudoduganella plicata TaxID=321984 RepID=A0AA87Y455_9BURK|nr:hypothetical protein GCM10007388_27110 [Pseudoduganella plicata]
MRIADIERLNWIYIWHGSILTTSTDEMHIKDNAMNTTTFDTAARDTAANRGWLKALGARLRHALETLGRPYVNGQFPSY